MSELPKICMVTVQHVSKDDRIYFKQARSLSAAGFEVSILTANSNGKPLDMSRQEIAEGPDEYGIEHICIKEPENRIQRLLKKGFSGRFYTEMTQAAVETGAQIFVAHEAQALPIARRAAKSVRGIHVYDAHESLHVENPKEQWAQKIELPHVRFLTTANAITREEISQRTQILQSEVIYNASLIEGDDPDPDMPPLIIHEGSLPFNRGLRLMMEALGILKQEGQDFQLRIVGELKGEEAHFFKEKVREYDLEKHIEVTGWIAYESLGEALHGGTIGLILNTPEPNNLYGGPANKLFNYMAKNMAVVAVDLPETTRILAESQAGITLKQREARELADTLSQLIQDRVKRNRLRRNAHKAHQQHGWKQEAIKLTSFYQNLVKQLP